MAADTDLFPRELLKKKNKKYIIEVMKKLFILFLVFFAFGMSVYAKKEIQPTSKNEVKLNIDTPQINLKSEQKKNNEDSIKLKYSTDLKEKSNTRLFDNQVKQNRQQYAKTIDKKMAEAPVAPYTYSNEPDEEQHVMLDTQTMLNTQPTVNKIYSENVDDGEKQTETVFSKPFKDNKVDFGVGTEKTFPNENQPAQSQINVGTKIRL